MLILLQTKSTQEGKIQVENDKIDDEGTKKEKREQQDL